MGAFERETRELSGDALSIEDDDYVGFRVLKTNPIHERNAVIAALVARGMKRFEGYLANEEYVCDGPRSINHETAFQDYLEKYFGFRKAYCCLHIACNPRIKWIIYSYILSEGCFKA